MSYYFRSKEELVQAFYEELNLQVVEVSTESETAASPGRSSSVSCCS